MKTATIPMGEYDQLEEFKKAFKEKSIVKYNDYGGRIEYLAIERDEALDDLADEVLKTREKVTNLEIELDAKNASIFMLRDELHSIKNRSLWQRILNK
jgi:hypothetical protein